MERGYVKAPWGQVHYFQEGKGDPLLLWPNRPRGSSIFKRLAGLLAPHYRVVAIDPPGFGSSDPQPSPFYLADITEAAVVVMDALGIRRARVCGYHGGAMVAGELAAAHPERVVAIVMCGYPLWTREEVRRFLDGTEPIPSGVPDVKPDGAHMLPLLKMFPPLPDEDLDYVHERIIDTLIGNAAGMPAAVSVRKYDPYARLPLVKCPALIVSTPSDPPFQQRGDQIQKLIRGSKTLTLEGGPYLHYHGAERLSRALLDFFKSA